VGAADEGTGRAVGFRGHAAGIHDDYIGGGGMAFVEPRGTQTAAERLAIGSRRPASEVFHVEFRHASSLELSH
jgi:hypothetical protein